VIPLQIRRGNQVVSGEAWRLDKEAYLERVFPIFGLKLVWIFQYTVISGSFFSVKATLKLQALDLL
jgi:hypothetical protein